MERTVLWRVLIAAALVIFCVWQIVPLQEKISLGLDLQGGMHLVLKVDTSQIPEKDRADAADRALEVIRNRVDQFGVKEPSIQRQGEDEIVVQLPGITDRARALELIGRTAQLQFKLVSDDPEKLNQALAGTPPAGYELKQVENEELLLEQEASMTGDALVDAQMDYDQSRFNQPYVSFTLSPQWSRRFARLTRANIGKRLAIVLDDKVMSAPVIQSEIPAGKGQITGQFNVEEATDLAIVLRAGALPAPIRVEEERTVGPLLGSDSIRAGLQASIAGLALVVVFMIVYYLLAGVIASVAVALNFLFILGFMTAMGGSLTLPGIAGMILTIGMAVDANVLINERIREELAAGRAIKQAIGAGYAKAFTAIVDSNVTTLIASFLLFQFGTGPIRGFGVTLTIGLLASMFTAVVLTRTIFDILLNAGWLTNLRMLRLIGETKINFIGVRRFCYTSSLVVLVGGVGYFISRGEQAYGIDFTGGQIQEYRFAQRVSVEQVRAALGEIGLRDATIQEIGTEGTTVIVKTADDTYDAVSEKLKAAFPENAYQMLRIEKVGPSVGKDLRTRAWLALLYSLSGILVYVAFRFKNVAFGMAGVLALFHDVLVTLGFLAITHREISLTIVAALLTIAGYSINDTIVIYDRVRENLRLARKKVDLAELINLSVNQTLSRTILTSGVTLLAVLGLYLFGGDVLRDFSFALLIGFTSGVYSTVYIVSPLVLAWQGKRSIR